jgi:hypothetical protein
MIDASMPESCRERLVPEQPAGTLGVLVRWPPSNGSSDALSILTTLGGRPSIAATTV